MNVSRITQLFSVQGSVPNAQESKSGSVDLEAKLGAQAKASTPAQGNDAVTVGQGSDPAARAAKVASIRAAVDSGSYDYNRPGVATAVYRDLL